VRQAGLTEIEVEEVVQQVGSFLATGIADGALRPKKRSLKSWLLKVTGWRIVDVLRKRGKTAPGSTARQQDLAA
jgi:hypothetical protein